MPYKKGPNGTLRFYSKRTGKYCIDPNLLFETVQTTQTKDEKELKRRQSLYNAAVNSKDKGLFEIYCVLESVHPGCVKNINVQFKTNKSPHQRELDIVTSRAIYEIKSGRARHKEKQYEAQKQIADLLGKKHIIYSPKSSNYQVKCLREKGYTIFNDYAEFCRNEGKKK